MLVRRSILVVLAVALACAGSALAKQRQHRLATSPSGLVWGVTLDDDAGIGPRRLAAQVDALGSLPIRPTSRVVMDWNTTVADYADAIPAVHGVSDVVAELGDSSELKGVSTSAYARWVQKQVAAYKGQVDVWEVGNEVNGEWVGTPARELSRVQAAADIVEAAGGKTALTLYYNPDCWSRRANELWTWLANNAVPRTDYVTVSYYPGDCNGYWPSAATWQSVFDRLHARFPQATLAFGESGQSANSLSQSAAAALLAKYTAVQVAGDNYVGGYFWWSWAENAVPRTNPFWAAYAAAQH